MVKKVALTGFLASAMLFASQVKIPVNTYQPRPDDSVYQNFLKGIVTTPSRVNTTARAYLQARQGIGVPETLRVLALRVEFVEDDDSTSWGNGKMDFVGYGSPSDGLLYDPPHDRDYFVSQMQGLRNFYLLNSRGRLVVEYDVFPADPLQSYQVPHKMSFYGDTSNLDRGLTLFMRDALLAAAEDPDIDFNDYQYPHQSNTFDMIVIFHAGSTIQSSLPFGYVNDLASATITPGALEHYTGLPYVNVGGVQIATASVVPESPRVEGYMIGLPGLLYHEFAHLLGAYDLYDITYYTQGVGAWALMGGGGWLGYPPGQIPSMHDAFHRYWFYWEDPIEVTEDTTIALYAAEFDTLLNPDWEAGLRPTMIKVPITDKEYFLIENRQVDVQGIKIDTLDTVTVDLQGGVPIWVDRGEYDSFQPGAGIIIWHIDEDLIEKYGSINAINAWTAFDLHNAVDMEEADGIQDYELLYYESSGTFASQGSQFDPFFTEKRDGSAAGNSEFSLNTKPSSEGYYGESGITIKVLDPVDTVMRVELSFDGKKPGFPRQAGFIKEIESVVVTDLDGNGSNELIAAGRDGQITHIYAWQPDGSAYGIDEDPMLIGFADNSLVPPALGDVDGDGIKEVVLAGHDGRITIYDPETLISPTDLRRYTTDGRIFTSPMLTNLDSDSQLEILSVDEYGNIYAFDVDDDTAMIKDGFPVDVGEEVRPGFALLDESDARFAVLSTSGRLYAFDASGNTLSGFPVDLGKGSAQCDIPPVVADFNGDGEREIAVLIYEYNVYRYLLLSLDGEILQRSTRTFNPPVTVPAIADIDADGLPELIFTSSNGLWALDENGTVVPNYPVVFPQTYDIKELVEIAGLSYMVTLSFNFSFRNSPVIGDLDNDGDPEIALGSPEYGIYVVESGQKNPQTSFYTRHGIGGGLALADIDNNGNLELVAGADSGKVHVWQTQGTELYWGDWMHDPYHTGLLTGSFAPPQTPTEPLSQVYVYPNPVRNSGYLHVLLGTVDDLKVQIFDIAGKPVASLEPEFDPATANDIPLDEVIADLVPGLYIVRVEVIAGDNSTVQLYKLGIIR